MSNFITAQLQFVSDAGDKNFAIVFIVILASFYMFSMGFTKQSLLMFATLASVVLSYVLKLIFKEPRPSTAVVQFAFDKYGFPSSHTLVFTVVFGFLIYLAFKLTGIPLVFRVIAIAISVYFISLVGISRVYLGQHYIWDVVAGYIFGVLFLILWIMLENKFLTRGN